MEIPDILNGVVLVLSGSLLTLMLVSSIIEKEKRAAILSLMFLVFTSTVWLLLTLFNHVPWVRTANTILLAVFALFAVISMVKISPELRERDLSNARQYDERDAMFSRNNLRHYPELMDRYYSVNPEKKEMDTRIHEKTEIGEPGAVYYDPYRSPVFEAAFRYLGRTRPASNGDINSNIGDRETLDLKKLTRTIEETARLYGAVDVGFVSLKPYHFYSHAGRRAEGWGREIKGDHKTAVVIVVAMDVEMMKQAPGLPVIMESSRQYVESAKIANIIAQYLRDLGYDSRAHTDGNYEVLCVPLAVDAGLGALGRIGIFMHPIHGPCVRLSAVTTELILPQSEPRKHRDSINSIQPFCEICKKCADNCPTHSIHNGEEPHSRGFAHWSVNQESCFAYWKHIGTDCGFCIRVCPYTKPDSPIHKLIRFYISRNPMNRRIALFMDDLFYSRLLKNRLASAAN